MKICLINPPSLKKRPVSRSMAGGLGFDSSEAMVLPPMDLAIFAARLRETGNDVNILDADALGYSDTEVLQQLEKHYDWILSPVSLPTLENDCQFIASLRTKTQNLAVKTSMRDYEIVREILIKSHADIVIHAECDLHIEQLLRGESDRGLAYLDSQQNLIFNDAPSIDNLDLIPVPARDLLANENYCYPLLGKGVATMQTSRGCPFPCSDYCPYPLVEGNSWRPQSAKRIYDEMETVVNTHGINKILFRDAVFTLDKERVSSVCDMIVQHKLDVSWWCETRADCLDENLMKVMRQGGCLGINIGVETGDERVMKSEAKRGLTLSRLRKLRDKAYEIGVKLHFLLSIGFPQETKKSIIDTFDMIRDFKPDSLGITVITPYPGTSLYLKAKRKGWIDSHNWWDYGGHQIVMHTDNLSREEIADALDYLHKGYQLMKMNTFNSSVESKLEEQLYRELLVWACGLTGLKNRVSAERKPLYKIYRISINYLSSILIWIYELMRKVMPLSVKKIMQRIRYTGSKSC